MSSKLKKRKLVYLKNPMAVFLANKLVTIFILCQWWPNRNFWTTGLVTLNGTVCELHLRMCSISVVGVYCMITIPAVFLFQALWWSLLPLRNSLPPRVVSVFNCSKASRPLLYKTDSLLKYGAISSTDSHSSLANIPFTSVALISYPATHSCSTSFIPCLFAFQEDSLQMCFHFLSEFDCSPRCFQGPSLGDLKNWVVNSNFGTWSCFFANIFQVRHGVLDIL